MVGVIGSGVNPLENCKKNIIAVEPKYDNILGGVLPAGYIGYDFDLPNDFGTTDATDTYLHIFSTNVAQHYYPPAVSNPTTPIVCTNTSAIQLFINNSLVADGFNANDLLYQVNADNTITVYASPSYPINGNEFWMGSATPDNYTNKYFPTIPTTHTYIGEPTCIEIQEIKEKDTCTGLETYRYVIEDGGGNLIDYIPTGIISNTCNKGIVAPNNIPTTELITGVASTFTVDNTYKSVAYVVIGNTGTIQTIANGVTRPLFDGESGEFKCDEGQTFNNTITFTTGANNTIILNLMSI